ncbi:hypothetical protein ABT301_32315 [Streptomyces sp. NPDC000987]|uniref:hypothetical protein n=1 Tax=Streptomyces sp. NPDC000987 TaxID=3154374 RepID=UPI00331859B3
MYLVHVSVRPRRGGTVLSPSVAGLIALACADRGGFEHVTVHADALPHPVLGLYLRADSLAEAETSADALWRHAALFVPQLRDWELVRAEVPLLRPEAES